MINDRKMDYLLKIAETRSITSAARALYVSQPALSQFVSSLEKEYDTKIFEYESGKLTPTYTGELIIESFKQQKLLESNLQRALNDARQSRSGRFSIGISNGRAPMFLSIVLPDFKKEYPNIQLTINTKSENGFESMVAAGKGENGLALGNVIGSNIFNILLILGISSLLSPIPVTVSTVYDMICLILVSCLCWAMGRRRMRYTRAHGWILVALYAVYMVYVVVRS